MKAITTLILAAVATGGASAQHGGHAGHGPTATPYADLRASHLRTHLRQTALLTRPQVERYQQLRGYTVTRRP